MGLSHRDAPVPEPFEPEDAGHDVPDDDCTDPIEASAFDLTRVRDAIATLPAKQRAAMALFYTEDLSVAEIAIALDVPPGTVKTRLMHARRNVRAQLEGQAP